MSTHRLYGLVVTPLLAAVLLAAAALPVRAQTVDPAKLDELQRIIQRQQQMIESQARALQALQKQVQALRDQSEANRRAVAATTGKVDKAVGQIKSAAAPPKMVTSGSGKVKLALSGQVNRALMLAGDGDQTDLFHVDNDTSSTRVRLVGEAKPAKDLTVGANIEVQMESNTSSGVSQNTESAAVGGASFTERILDVYVDSRYGKLTIGQGDTASNYSSEMDLSGTKVINYSDFPTIGGAFLFRNSTTNALTTVTVANVFNNFDGGSRDDRIRYDTPKFRGFQVSASHIQGGKNDMALTYAGDFSGAKVAVAGSFLNSASTSTSIDRQFSGSGSVLFPNGINLTAAGGTRVLRDRRDDPVFYYGKVGYQAKWFDFGKTALAFDLGQVDDLAAVGDDGTLYGFGVVQNITDWGTELYTVWRHFELDRPGAKFDDINVGMAGVRVKF